MHTVQVEIPNAGYLTPTVDNFLIGDGSSFVVSTPLEARGSIGLDTTDIVQFAGLGINTFPDSKADVWIKSYPTSSSFGLGIYTQCFPALPAGPSGTGQFSGIYGSINPIEGDYGYGALSAIFGVMGVLSVLAFTLPNVGYGHVGGIQSKVQVLIAGGEEIMDNLYGIRCMVDTVYNIGGITNFYGIKVDDIVGTGVVNAYGVVTGIGENYLGDDTEIDGDLIVDNVNDVRLGYKGSNNYWFGDSSVLDGLIDGDDNVGIGSSCLTDVTDGNRNLGVMRLAGYNITTGNDNLIVGYWAGIQLVDTHYNNLFGTQAGENLTGSSNSGYGYKVFNECELMIGSSAFGNEAMWAISSTAAAPSYCCAFGERSLYHAHSYTYATAMGYRTGYVGNASRVLLLGAYAGYRGSATGELFIDTYVRADVAEQRTDSLMYGIFTAASVADQFLLVNGVLKSSYGASLGDNAGNTVLVSVTGKLTMTGTSRIDWTKIAANGVTLGDGPPTSGDVVADLQTRGDGNVYAVAEASANAGQNLIVDFAGVNAFNWVEVMMYYDGQASHHLRLQLEITPFDDSAWHDFGMVFPHGDYMLNKSFFVQDDSPYINAGVVKFRVIHDDSGNSQDDWYFDVVALHQ